MVEPRTPVLVGVGTAHADVEAAELMARAAKAAQTDTGASGLLAATQRIAVPRGTWSYTDPARIVADRIGAHTPQTVLADVGIPQQTLINDALEAIIGGQVDIVLIVGAEAKARAARAGRRGRAADAGGIVQVMGRRHPGSEPVSEIDQHGAIPGIHQTPTDEIVSRPEIEAGLWAPVEQYALIEPALAAAEQAGVAQHRRQIAELWARFNEVARANPEAAFNEPMTTAELETFSGRHRPLAFPYGKWHASQWTVDQGAALLLCSAAAADRFGVPRDRWIFPLVGLESSLSVPLTNRRAMHRWDAMRVLGRAAAKHIDRPLADCDHAELYSCFPVAVRVQQRELDLPVDGTPTITGGMSFAGGPFNNFVLQATAAMARRLREQPGLGLVTTVSGLLTKPGLAVWSSHPSDRPPLVADLRDEATEATETIEAVSDYAGDATIAACTVTYDGQSPKELIAVVDTADGTRAIARTSDIGLATRATTVGLVGGRVTVSAGRFV